MFSIKEIVRSVENELILLICLNGELSLSFFFKHSIRSWKTRFDHRICTQTVRTLENM